MMTVIIIVLIMLLSSISIITTSVFDRNEVPFVTSILIFLLSLILLITLSIGDFHPTAMDVYQKKTTLKYTIVDGIKTDSVVIYKQK